MKCARHPDVETNLTCGKCGTPICPNCLVQTPVGARCPECAQLKRLPLFQLSAKDYLKAVGVGLGVAVGGGFICSFLLPFLSLFAYLIMAALGYGIGELISLAVNRKRGVGLQVIAGISTAVGYILVMGLFSLFSLFGLLALALAIFLAVSRLR